jgi:hypothetical protein
VGDEYISDGILSEVCSHLPPNEVSGVLATETMHCWRLTGALCAALRKVPVAGICGMFDTKREKVIR